MTQFDILRMSFFSSGSDQKNRWWWGYFPGNLVNLGRPIQTPSCLYFCENIRRSYGIHVQFTTPVNRTHLNHVSEFPTRVVGIAQSLFICSRTSTKRTFSNQILQNQPDKIWETGNFCTLALVLWLPRHPLGLSSALESCFDEWFNICRSLKGFSDGLDSRLWACNEWSRLKWRKLCHVLAVDRQDFVTLSHASQHSACALHNANNKHTPLLRLTARR